MKYYVLSLNDWEDYSPHWFACNCSKADFRKAVRETMAKAVSKLALKKNERFINGYDLLEKVIPLLEKKGFKLLKPDYELQFYGMCFYSKSKEERRPTVIPLEAWKKILAHNDRIDKEMDEKWEIREKARKRKKKTPSKCND
jgi:hypothetical protein